jgi:hypothetical protein
MCPNVIHTFIHSFIYKDATKLAESLQKECEHLRSQLSDKLELTAALEKDLLFGTKICMYVQYMYVCMYVCDHVCACS